MAVTCKICGTWGNHGGDQCPLYRLNEQQEALAPIRARIQDSRSAESNSMLKEYTMKKLLILPLIAVTLLFAGCPKDNYAKAGQLAKDFASSVALAQQTEITLHAQGKIDDATHVVIEQKFSDISDAGVTLDKAINQTHSASDAAGAVQVALNALNDLSVNALAGIKDQNTQLAVKTLLLAAQTTLDNIVALAGGSSGK